jgi:L-alanine-DL-glutamate epimerase-like enolase superfamily enzyme|tara:strand:+ start:13569 stop:14936 length:1368 start_codon:yes stop_codon:yes gene_type:complete
MKIKKIEVFSTHEPYKRPIPIAVGTHDNRNNILVKITADNSLSGWGEGSPLIPSYSGEVRDQMVDDIVKRIAPDILEQKITTVDDILVLIQHIRHNKYYFQCAIAAVDIALFDLLGKQKKKPVYELIRDYLRLKKFNKLPELPANFTVSRNATRTDDKIDEMIKEADYYVSQGYSVIKIKIGIFKNSDERAVKKLYQYMKKNHPNHTVNLFVDGNQAYSTVQEALTIINKIKPYIDGLEQPFHRNIPYLSASLYKKFKSMKDAPFLITDEGSSSIEEMENVMISHAAAGSLLKMVRSGGFSFVIWLSNLLRKYPKFKLEPMSMTETGIGTTANLHSALVIYEHCNLNSGFGFDGPMQVIGDSYKTGKDTIIYKNKKTGLIIKNKKGVAIYDAEQIIGDGEGLGININQKYIDKITKVRIVIWLENSNVFKEEIVGKVNKKEIIGKQKTILKHPRY